MSANRTRIGELLPPSFVHHNVHHKVSYDNATRLSLLLPLSHISSTHHPHQFEQVWIIPHIKFGIMKELLSCTFTPIFRYPSRCLVIGHVCKPRSFLHHEQLFIRE